MVRSWWEEERGEGGQFDRQTNRQCDCISLISLGNSAKNKRFYLPLGIKKNVSYIFTKHLFLCILINSQDERGSLHWISSKELKGRAGGTWIAQFGILLGIWEWSSECSALYTIATLPKSTCLPCKPTAHWTIFQSPTGWMQLYCISDGWCALDQILGALYGQQTLLCKRATRKWLHLFRFMV